MAKELKEKMVGVRLSKSQMKALKELADSEKVPRHTLSGALSYLLNEYMIKK
ncbi:hypothetical protein [Enterobacter kobei]|uniref:hypothetical protein n=1 Tax=Enterobacter kobei TaxID=208224 RepID=UPI0018A54328|nr:hypothetical protein [Enterobacter kobei]BBV85974.1 hypothetical protein STW0522ENT62_14200 [Enterobacter kobei]